MRPHQRTPQPLERAVQKALARKAELRTAAQAPIEPEISPLDAEEPPLELHHTAQSTTAEPQSRGRAALSAETMSLIERMASSEPFADADLAANPGPFAAADPVTADAVATTERFDHPGSAAKDATTAEQISSEPSFSASEPSFTEGDLVAESSPAADQEPNHNDTPQKRPSTSTGTVDAFQLLLANNPAAGDNTRTDLRDAPSLRNPRKIMLDESNAASSSGNSSDYPSKNLRSAPTTEAKEDKERSLRNWFSPKSDPNPPPPPETDPTLE